MRVLGIDPGVADTGWAVLEQPEASRGPQLISSGLVRTEAGVPLAERLLHIHGAIAGIFDRYRPEAVAIEEMFFLKAAHTVRATLQARGVILLAASQARTSISEYNPRQVKAVLTGSGSALKPQMQKMIQQTLGLNAPLRPDDVADAAAIALCHFRLGRAGRMRVLDRIGARG